MQSPSVPVMRIQTARCDISTHNMHLVILRLAVRVAVVMVLVLLLVLLLVVGLIPNSYLD